MISPARRRPTPNVSPLASEAKLTSDVIRERTAHIRQNWSVAERASRRVELADVAQLFAENLLWGEQTRP